MNNVVLFISPDRSGASLLARMLGPVSLSIQPVLNLEQARSRLLCASYPVILTDTRLSDGSWTDVLDLAREMELPSAVIVTDRLADDLLWAEVLNLGAYDLLVQPFDTSEVQRILLNACSMVPHKAATSQVASAGKNSAQAIV